MRRLLRHAGQRLAQILNPSLAIVLLMAGLLSCSGGPNDTRTTQPATSTEALTLQAFAIGSSSFDFDIFLRMLTPLSALTAQQQGRWDGKTPLSEPVDSNRPCLTQTYTRVHDYGIAHQQVQDNCQSDSDAGTTTRNGTMTVTWDGYSDGFTAQTSVPSERAAFPDGTTSTFSGAATWTVAGSSNSVATSTGRYQFRFANNNQDDQQSLFVGDLEIETQAQDRFIANGDWSFRFAGQRADVAIEDVVFQYGGFPTGCPERATDNTEIVPSTFIIPIDGDIQIRLPEQTIQLEYLQCTVRESIDGTTTDIFDGRLFSDQITYFTRYQSVVPGARLLRLNYLNELQLALVQNRWCGHGGCLGFEYNTLADATVTSLLSLGSYAVTTVTDSINGVTGPGIYQSLGSELQLTVTATTAAPTTYHASLTQTTLELIPSSGATQPVTLQAAPFLAQQTKIAADRPFAPTWRP